jgi:hypothetical protein
MADPPNTDTTALMPNAANSMAIALFERKDTEMQHAKAHAQNCLVISLQEQT